MGGGEAEEARGGGGGQQDGPYHLGHDGEWRDLPTSEGGLSPPTTGIEYTWHWQGQQQQDGDRSIRGSGQPGESVGAQTSLPCLGPDPRNPSGPAVKPTAHKGRTYDRKPTRPVAVALPCETGAVHIWIPAYAGMTRTDRCFEVHLGWTVNPRRRFAAAFHNAALGCLSARRVSGRQNTRLCARRGRRGEGAGPH